MNPANAILKTVPHNRPKIFKSVSKQSIAASDDYHSFSDYASDGSSVNDQAAMARWATPPSQNRSPESATDHLRRDATSTAKLNSRDRLASRSPVMAEVPEVRSRGGVEGDLSPPTPGVDDTPYIHYAIEQITRDHADPRSRRPATGSTTSTYPVERIMPARDLEALPPNREKQPEVPLPRDPEPHSEPQILVPVDPPGDSLRYPQLTHLPAILRLPSLLLLTLLCLMMTAALIFCAVWSRRHDGLLDYTNADDGRYFLFQFLPQIIAAIVLLYVLYVQLAVMRMMPFIYLASDHVKLRSNALLLSMRPSSLLFPQIRYFRAGNGLIAACLAILWLSVFTIPLQSCLFQVRWARSKGQLKWRWVTAEPVAWTLVALYATFSIALAILAGYLFRRRTGLKWEPNCLASLVALLQQSNSLHDYEASETFRSRYEFKERLKLRSDKLGYWMFRDRPGHIFYAIAEGGAPTRRYSLQQGRIKKYTGDDRRPADVDLEAQQPPIQSSNGKLSARIRSPLVRYRFVPWYIRDTFVVAWIVIAIVLLIAFLVVSFLHGGVRRGFRPLLDATPTRVGFSSPGFLYSFLPSLLGVILFLFWQTIDLSFRALQPFANMSRPDGASAEDSLLLDYTGCLPVEVTIKAAVAGHWKVAWISFISLLSLTIPIIAGGVFWAIDFPKDREVRMVARMPAFGTLVAFLIIYSISFLFIWPRRKRYLPHDIRSLAELISFLYRSPLLRDPMFREPQSKTDLVTRLFGLAPGEKEPRRYHFGVYQGLDGNEHLGIDRLQRYDLDPAPARKRGMI